LCYYSVSCEVPITKVVFSDGIDWLKKQQQQQYTLDANKLTVLVFFNEISLYKFHFSEVCNMKYKITTTNGQVYVLQQK